MNVLLPGDGEVRQLWGELTDRYDLYGEYEKAHARKDPLLAPHGFFRALQPKNIRHAKEFLEKFGPLTTEQGNRFYWGNPAVRVDLGEFWSLHLRFILIAELWESLDDKERLAEILLEIYALRKELSAREKFSLGTQFRLPPSNRKSRYKFPWQSRREKAKTWLKHASLAEIRESALTLVNLELNAHMRGRQIVWQRGWEESGRKYRTVVWVESLWSAIWEFFGWDTAGLSWRRCPHCQKFFYPKRKDQFYCTRRQQALASKRVWAARQRAKTGRTEGRLNRKGSPMKTTTAAVPEEETHER
jgi:hypothetical protein